MAFAPFTTNENAHPGARHHVLVSWAFSQPRRLILFHVITAIAIG
jgi:hypothetical protein